MFKMIPITDIQDLEQISQIYDDDGNCIEISIDTYNERVIVYTDKYFHLYNPDKYRFTMFEAIQALKDLSVLKYTHMEITFLLDHDDEHIMHYSERDVLNTFVSESFTSQIRIF